MERVCSICRKSPVLYYSNGELFCKSHKSEATVRAEQGLLKYKSQAAANRYATRGGTIHPPAKGKGTSQQQRFRHFRGYK